MFKYIILMSSLRMIWPEGCTSHAYMYMYMYVELEI